VEVSCPAPASTSSVSRFALDIERISPYFLAVLIAYALLRNLCQAAIKPLWFDEICTVILARQPRISTIYSALKHGADSQPIAFLLAERFVTAFVPSENISFRLLSILGFSCVLLCLFILIRQRSGNLVALFCASIPLVTVAYSSYAVEARAYSLVLACISFALICYQRAPARHWTVLLGVSLALAEFLHYYSVLIFVPFMAAEMAFLLIERRFRWGVWLGLGCGFLPLALFWQLLSILRTLYGEHTWAPPTLRAAESSYGFYFHTTLSVGIDVAAVAALTVLARVLYERRRAAREKQQGETSLHEAVLPLAFLTLPFVGFLTTKFAHGQFSPHYMLPTVLGFPLAIAYSVPRLEGRKLSLFSALTVLFLIQSLVPSEMEFWTSHGFSTPFHSPADTVEKLVGMAGHEDLPVVVSDLHDFMPLSHYASPEWQSRFVAVVDVPESIVYIGTDNGDKQLQILRSYSSLRVYDFREFAAKNPVFLLYSSNGGADLDWWPRKLKHDGYVMIPAVVKPKSERDYFHRVFLVTRGKDMGETSEVEKASVPLRK
jgi:hypothetical protein